MIFFRQLYNRSTGSLFYFTDHIITEDTFDYSFIQDADAYEIDGKVYIYHTKLGILFTIIQKLLESNRYEQEI